MQLSFSLLTILCQTNSKPYKSTPVDTKGYIYVYKDDEGKIPRVYDIILS